MMEEYPLGRDLFFERLKLAIEYCQALSILRGVRVVASILIAKLLRRRYIKLPVPGTRQNIRLRTISSDIATYHDIFVRQEYDFLRFPQAKQFLEAKPVERPAQAVTIIDCGANVGCSVIWFASKFPAAEILAIEPDPTNFALLNRNVADLRNIRTLHAALWSSETQVTISNPDAKPWAFRTDEVSGKIENDKPAIGTVTMDSLLANIDSSAAVIVKIDIEGAECEVFSKNISWLRLVDLLIIELHDNLFPWMGNGRTFFSAVASMPMDYVWRSENLFCFQKRETGPRRPLKRQSERIAQLSDAVTMPPGRSAL
jgi:FkbM family methyltransferase